MNAFLMATAVALSAPPAADQPAPATHEVLTGESLSGIARCELGNGDRWGELVELNRDLIGDPDLIEAGWVLVLPEKGAGDCPVPAMTRASAPARPRASRSAPAPAKKRAAVQRSRARTAGGLASVRNCESGGDYGAVSANGTYRGAYQFDRQTWVSVGGSGDPAAASADEQDQRAATLYAQRGKSAWPSCD
ncbi:MAG TPA: transglycosylase family protein [Acidimicrobiales bacterium]|nr:transglycosylase family protein [Acidimicrobiales bacterium]